MKGGCYIAVGDETASSQKSEAWSDVKLGALAVVAGYVIYTLIDDHEKTADMRRRYRR